MFKLITKDILSKLKLSLVKTLTKPKKLIFNAIVFEFVVFLDKSKSAKPLTVCVPSSNSVFNENLELGT